MGNFRICQEGVNDFTVVNNLFIDNYMADANDAQLKIYLYLLRMLNSGLSTGVSDIADRFNYTEKDVMRALDYWDRQGVIRLDRSPSGELVGVRIVSLGAGQAQAAVEDVPAPEPEPGPAEQPRSARELASIVDISNYSKPQYTGDDLTRFRDNPDAAQIIYVAELYLRRTLSQDDVTTLIFISDQLNFSYELIDYLLEVCADKGKTNIRYIEKVAIDWAQSGVTTTDEARAHLCKFDSPYEIMRALGKNSDPSTVELEFINKWMNVYGFDKSVILEACARTVISTDKARFKYADSILTGWHQKGVHTLEDVQLLDPPKKKPAQSGSKQGTAGKNKFSQFTQNQYDYEELEKKLISN